MNGNILKDFQCIKDRKWLVRILILVAGLTYGYFITHSTIGMDDTAIERYFVEGWAPYVGRWTLFMLNKVLNFAHYTPYFMDALGVVLLCIAALLFCVLWYRICNKNLNILACIAFSTIFITYPLIGEVYIYYLHNGISLSFVFMALIGLAWWEYLSKGNWKQIIWMVVLLSLAIGCYESFALVYIVLICGIYVVSLSKGSLAKRKFIIWMKDVALSIVPLLLSMLIRTIMYSSINAIMNIESNARDMSALKLWFINDPIIIIKDLIYQFLMRYVLNGEYIFAIKIYVITMIVFAVMLIVMAIVKKKWQILLFGFVMMVSPWLLVIIQLVITPYRAGQALMLLIALAWFWFFDLALSFLHGKVLNIAKPLLAIVLFIVVFRQGFELHQYFYFDYIKSEYDKNYCEEIAKHVMAECDTDKPVIFIGQRELPEGFRNWVFLEADSQEYYIFSRQFNLLYTKAFYKYVNNECGYCIYDIASSDTMSWLTWADLGDGEYEIYRYMEMLGYDFVQPTGELRDELLEDAVENPNYPIWPQAGSVVETKEYICIYLGPVTVNM